ncbi:MAG TPA: DMT family transporter [Gemmatimonadales bacterium]|nr:DMT family transporter [Gemmatimonadales bacterium]
MNRRPLALTALAVAGVLWGTSFIFGKIALEELSVGHMLLYRFVIASVAFLPLMARGEMRLNRQDWLMVLGAAAIGVPLQFLLQFEGLAHTTASHAALMIGTAPVLIAVAAFFVFQERLRTSAWLALLGSTIGVVLTVWGTGSTSSAGGPTLYGDLLVLASLFAGVFWVLASKRLMTRHSAIAVSGLITVIGTVMLAAWVLGTEGMPSATLHPATWIAVAAMGLLTTTCTIVLWNWGLSHVSTGHAAAFINLEPVVGALLGVLVLHETLGPFALVGGACIVAGAVVVSLQD